MNNDKIEIMNFEENNNMNSFSVVETYGEDLTAKQYITNPAIAREEEIKKMMIVLMTPEKSALLIGKPGIGKTAIVEGLSYLIQQDKVPNALKGYKIIKFNSTSLVGTININGEEKMIMSLFVSEIKKLSKTIVFIDEIHTLMGAKNSGPLDLANILKPGLDRGEIKLIGATTTIEYDTYVIRDRAFLRRFDRIDVEEPSEKTTTQILLGTIKKIETQTGIKFKYHDYVAEQIIDSIVSATSEFKRVYGLSAMYPDVSLSVLTQAFSYALLSNKEQVELIDVYNAIRNSKRIYPDSIVKELAAFKIKFAKLCEKENIVLPDVTLDELNSNVRD